MTVFVATYRYVPEPGRLAAVRPERLSFFRRLEEEGTLLASGQLLGADFADGMLALDAPDAATAAAALDDDPFVRENLVAHRSLAPWHATVGAWVRG